MVDGPTRDRESAGPAGAANQSITALRREALGRGALESPESSSPIVTRAVAAGFQGEYCASYRLAAWQRLFLRLLGTLPQDVGRFAISRFETLSGLDPRRLSELSIDRLARERLQDYAGLPGPFPVVTMGAALGGASAHLSLALGGPFLPQAFVVTIRGGSPRGDVRTYYERSCELAHRIASQDPNILTIQHYDPVHDEWMTRFANHLRFKLLDLPQEYRDFLRRTLQPGGVLVFLECQAQWLRYRVGERSFLQVGGWGGISAREFLEGSPRLERYCRANRLAQCAWQLDGFPLEQGPESEWGTEPALASALEDFCRTEGYRFVRITLPEPHDFSRLAYLAVEHLVRSEGREPAGVSVEMFSQFDATAVRKSGLLPLWLVFNTSDSLEFLEQMRPSFPRQKPVFFSPLATFTRTPDIAPWAAWEKALRGLDWRNTGARSSHYPADARALVDWAGPLRRWVDAHSQPSRSHLRVDELLTLSQKV